MWLLALVIAFVVSRALFAAVGFDYDLFSDRFDLRKLAIDFGVWAIVCAATLLVLDRVATSRRSDG